MTRYDDLMTRVRAGELILLDGATGSEMQRRGVPEHENGWYGGAAVSHPEIVQAVHAEYIRLGANVVISNTFATHRSVLRDAGVDSQFDELNRRSVELAVAARDASDQTHVVVGAGVSHWSFTGENPPLDELERSATEQMAIMAEAGAEVIILEMMVSIARMQRLIAAARTTGLPIWVGISVGGEEGELPDRSRMTLRDDDEELADAIGSLDPREIDVLSIMHTDVDLVDPCLDISFEAWSSPVGVYAHSWRGIDPPDYADLAARWVGRGVGLIGGCCGTVPAHIDALTHLASD